MYLKSQEHLQRPLKCSYFLMFSQFSEMHPYFFFIALISCSAEVLAHDYLNEELLNRVHF